MTTTKEIQKIFHNLIDLIKDGYSVEIKEGYMKNYTEYVISKTDGTAKFQDSIIMYNGEQGDDENICLPKDIPAIELCEEIEVIKNKIDSIFK